MAQKGNKFLEKMTNFQNLLKAKFFDDSEFLNFCLHYCRFFFIEHDRISPKTKFILKLVYFSSTIINCLAAVVSFFNVRHMIEKLEVLLIFSLHVTNFANFLFFKASWKEIWTMVEHPFKTDSPLYIGQEACKITSQILKRTIIVLFMVNSGIIVSSSVLTFLGALFTNVNDSNDNMKFVQFVIPYWFACGQPSVVKFCLEARNDTQLWIINFMQMLSLLYEINLNLALMLVYLILTCGIQAKAEVFRIRLCTLAKQISKLNISKANFLHEQFGHMVRHQFEIRRFTDDIRPLINFPLLLHVQSFYAIMVLAAFLLVTKGNHNILILMKTAYYILLGSIFHYIICQNSMSVSEMNEHLMNSLMDFPWYEQNEKFRKSYLMTLIANHKPMSVKLYGLYRIDLQYFAGNMRGIFSLLNILVLLENHGTIRRIIN